MTYSLILATFDLLLGVPAFAALNQPGVAAAERRDRKWWLSLAITAALPALTYFPLMKLGQLFFPMPGFPQWVQNQLPPQGSRFHTDDATVWDWVRIATPQGIDLARRPIGHRGGGGDVRALRQLLEEAVELRRAARAGGAAAAGLAGVDRADCVPLRAEGVIGLAPMIGGGRSDSGGACRCAHCWERCVQRQAGWRGCALGRLHLEAYRA